MKMFNHPFTTSQWKIIGYVFAILFGSVAILNPAFAYQVLGITLAIAVLGFGGILGYQVFLKMKQSGQIPVANITMILGAIALGVFFIWIPMITLKETMGVILIIGLLGLAAYHLYFVRKQYINPLQWKNYLIGILSLVGMVLIVFNLNTISDLLMILFGIACISFSGYQLMLLFVRRP
jgi:uncharacterized membrane protein HdeD (DUF308 family)